ncbi:cytochrome P450 [Vararia minispora EC-137]|uniref:Cytochrome P450 n=1 Tax=Vararia minispora EC-137 TaxID=1314806 RepID=A0ACB8Q608_9AGAM|nr:cytochrome P450 [Vararia minispora EC-137]
MPVNIPGVLSGLRAHLAFLPLTAEPGDVSVSSPLASIIIALFSLLAVYLITRYLKSPWRYLPPGPIGYPIVGSALSLLDKKRFFSMCESYVFVGDIAYVNLAGQPTIVLSTQQVVADLLDRRAGNFSGRPRLIFSHELLAGGMTFTTEGHTPRWRRMRRAVNEAFRPSAVGRYHTIEADKAAQLALALADNPHDTVSGGYSHHYASYAASVVLAITYDLPILNTGKGGIIDTVERIARDLARASAPGTHLVDLFPRMLDIPDRYATWKLDAATWHRCTSEFLGGLVGEVKERMEASGEARPCLAQTLVEEADRFGLSETEISWAAGVMYIAGSETQAITLEWFTLAMVGHLDVQRRAQAELDAVVGRARAPRVGDREQLPYVSVLVREVLRWRPPVPMGLPHKSEEDEWYRGFFIPKGTLCIINVPACHSDAEVYGEDAAEFNPARHLDEKGRLKPAPADTKDEGHISYGSGRRICVGRHVANDALFAAVATILWAFNLRAEGAFDMDGYVDRGITVSPIPFACKFEPRFAEALATLSEEVGSR